MTLISSSSTQKSGVAPAALHTEKLTMQYARKVAFRDVTLSVPAGQITALIGPSGCGKTSFLNCLNRLTELTPNTQTTGTVLLDGQNIQAMELIQLRRRVGMLFQKPNPFPLSIYRNLEFPLQEHGIGQRDRVAQIIEINLRRVGLWEEVKDRLKSPALALSGGQQQRLCLARTLALNPEVLLMDEPCSALDPISSEVVEALIDRLRGDYTVLVVTHNLAQARRIADRVALFWMEDTVGKLIESGSGQELFESPQHPLTQAYISGKRG
ncbi:MAG: phosphate ABC transporter ATP-binding protein [Synechococcales cyanobacterium CRU_2_2]|nr:phosphate ABC transporter ATP-binding protein [Synechococcales cyanobacterium CRU_2_2]